MEIDYKLLKKLSRLAGLKIKTGKETEELKDFLTKTLSYFEKIKEIDTQNVPPLNSPLSGPLRMRKDEFIPFSNKEKLLEQAPQKKGHLIKAPLIL
ncbi:MAG: Asp-tRNA(Asn)/Glu-tRNA(Gln) amidotransferase subunit GatC [Bdellovibrionaceae bacterium]|nr:Asp-tRNA(Asn)/Glu-tRNA(Gln) amidotransferase subunit GatC [Pseudobdellovibrionaceae bacterium]